MLKFISFFPRVFFLNGLDDDRMMQSDFFIAGDTEEKLRKMFINKIKLNTVFLCIYGCLYFKSYLPDIRHFNYFFVPRPKNRVKLETDLIFKNMLRELTEE